MPYTGCISFLAGPDQSVLSLLLLLSACVPRHPVQVQALADRATLDQAAMDELVRSLRSKDPDVWHLAYGELLEIGDPAVPALRQAVVSRKKEAGRALLLLAEMGDPANYDLIEAAESVPQLAPYAVEAWELAEEVLYDRAMDERDLALCDAYLEFFPDASGVAHIQDRRWALESWVALDQTPRHTAELERFQSEWGDAPAAIEARAILADQALQRAQDALRDGRAEQALSELDQVDRWQERLPRGLQTRDTDVLRSQALTMRGRTAASAANVQTAIDELERAQALGGGDTQLLSDLYVQRSRDRFASAWYRESMEDLERAQVLQPSKAPELDRLRAERIDLMVDQVGGRLSERAIGGLVVAGPAARMAMGDRVLERFDQGDAEPLRQLVRVSMERSNTGGPDARDGLVATGFLVEQALSAGAVRVQPLLDDPASLLDPEDPWTGSERARREQATQALQAWITAVDLAQSLQAQGLQVEAPRAALLRADQVTASLQALPAADHHRAQVLLEALLITWAAAESPSQDLLLNVLAAGPPEDLLGLAAMEHLRPAPRDLGGVPIRTVAVTPVGTTLLCVVKLNGLSQPISDAGLGQLLNLLFTLAPAWLAANPEVATVAVRVDFDDDPARVTLRLNRESSERMNWPLIWSEGPYSADHLAFVVDHEIR